MAAAVALILRALRVPEGYLRLPDSAASARRATFEWMPVPRQAADTARL